MIESRFLKFNKTKLIITKKANKVDTSVKQYTLVKKMHKQLKVQSEEFLILLVRLITRDKYILQEKEVVETYY